MLIRMIVEKLRAIAGEVRDKIEDFKEDRRERREARLAERLDERAATHKPPLNWRTSIVDLLKAADLDSSRKARDELAADLGVSDYDGSEDANVRLHQATMDALAGHGYRLI